MAGRGTRVAAYLMAALVGIVALVIAAVLVVTNTDWGRERVRRQVVGIMGQVAHGHVQVGRLDGDLLRGIIATDVSITDSSGAPLVTADSLLAGYALPPLLRKRIVLHDVRMVNPLIVLDLPPGGEWNFARIFPTDTTSPPDSTPGWGSWLSLEDVSIVNGRVIARLPWEPDSALTGAARDSAIDVALSPESRANVEAVEGGWQVTYDMRRLDAALPRLRVADPDLPGQLVEVATLSTEAYPFRPPAAMVHDLSGTFHVTSDSLWFGDATVQLPGSRMAGSGTLVFGGRTELRLDADPLTPGDLRWLYPALPEGGDGAMELAVYMNADSSRFIASDTRITLDSASLTGTFGVLIAGDTLGFVDTDLDFANVRTALVEQLVPGLDIPRRGTISGRAALDGPLRALTVDADVAFDDADAGMNRALARGMLGWEDGIFSASALRVELHPLQVALARMVDPTLPVDGVVTGTATLDGSTASSLRARFDLAHSGRTGVSRLAGDGTFRQQPTLAYDVDARISTLALATPGLFAPAAGLHGTASGPIQLQGTSDSVHFTSELAIADGGELRASGGMHFGDTPSYTLLADMRELDASAATTRSPSTSLTGRLFASGTGFEPTTMRAELQAELAGSRVDTVAVDSVLARVAVADGLARVDTLAAHGRATLVTASGDFGLGADREGTLTYHVAVDSLGAYADLLAAPETTLVRPRPRLAARALAAARADSARAAQSDQVRRMATGAPPPRLVEPEAIPAIPRDSVAGAVYAAGVVHGNIERADVRGRAGVVNLVLRGNVVNQARAEYAWVDGLTPDAAIVAALRADTIRAAGLALDSAEVRVAYRNERGTADLLVVQDDTVDFRTRANFRLALDEKEVSFEELALRIDTTRWVATREGAVRWGGKGVLVDSVALTAGPDRWIVVNGLIPTSGDADLTLSIRGLDVGAVSRLAQSAVPIQGMLAADATVTGSAQSPIIEGTVALTDGKLRTSPLPELHSDFDYAREQLSARARLVRNDSGAPPLVIARATGTVPINLAFETDRPRLPNRPLAVDVDADSLPLTLMGQLTDVVANVDGDAAGSVRVRGTTRNPEFVGALTLSHGQALLVPVGVQLREMSGRIRLLGDSVMVDSLVAFNPGRILVRGGIGIAKPTEPSFDLYLVANGATVLDNEQGRLRADAGLSMRGPFDRVYVSGATRITEGVIYIPEPTGKQVIAADDPALFNVVDTAVAAESELIPQASPLLQNLTVDVTLGIDRDTWVRSREANVEIFTPDDLGPLDVELAEGLGRIVVRGVVSTERGEYNFLSKRFQVDRGSVIFTGTPEINPLLQITGRYDVKMPAQKALAISVLIGGTLNDPQLSLESDAQPPLSQSDLISYLAFGRTSSSLLQLEGSGLSGGNQSGNLVGAVGAAATQRLGAIGLGVLVDQLEGQTSRSLGADVVNITPADLTIEASNPFSGLDALVRGTQVELGKYLNRNTFVSFMVRPSVFSGRSENRSIPGIRLQHRFGSGFSLDTSFEGRYVVQSPTLESNVRATSSGVFGLFLIREWGW